MAHPAPGASGSNRHESDAAADDNGLEDSSQHPFVTALPPKTDYISYLTIVESRLDKASLPLLDRLLQDERLATNTGWDLVHLLVPLLPESGPCLQTIARLGNPREVVLKVTEMLEIIGYDAVAAREMSSGSTSGDEEGNESRDADAAPGLLRGYDDGQKMRLMQFRHLLRMIGVLHPRIKTKRPSRFLMTTADAVHSAYRQLDAITLFASESEFEAGTGHYMGPESHEGTSILSRKPVDEQSATDAVLALIDRLAAARPTLPPRAGSAASISTEPVLADDPEAEPIDSSEPALQRDILVALSTRVAETLRARMWDLFPAREISWAQRYTTKEFPSKVVPPSNKPSTTQALSSRAQGDLTRLRLLLAARFRVRTEKLSGLVMGSHQDALDPSLAEDFPMSAAGACIMWAESLATSQKGDVTELTAEEYRRLVATFLGPGSSVDFGPESLAIVDAVLIIGWYSPQQPEFSDRGTEVRQVEQDSYNECLQQLSNISANAPYAGLRYQSHLLVSHVLEQTKNTTMKYSFIQDTIELCPFANLKVTAVGWLKDGILAAAQARRTGIDQHQADENMFGRSETLEHVAVSLFDAADAGGDEGAITAQMAFWLAALNLLYVVCSNSELRGTLDIKTLATKHDLQSRFIGPLGRLAQTLLEADENQGSNAELFSDAMLLGDAATRAEESMAKVDP